MVAKRFDVYFVNLDPTSGSEINKTRPCVIVSPDDLNRVLNTIIIAPLTSTIKEYPTRVNCMVKGKQGQVAVDQIRTIDKKRLTSKMDALDLKTGRLVLDVIQEIFEE